MDNLFKDILAIEDVLAVAILTPEGKVRFKSGKKESLLAAMPSSWASVVMALGGASSAEVVFEQQRIYFHRIKDGFIVVISGWLTPMAMVRLQSTVVAATLDAEAPKAKGLTRFFKRPRG